MSNRKIIPCIILAVIVHYLNVWAQQSANTSGGDAFGSGGSAAYSVGEVAYTVINGSGSTVSQGIQHPYEFHTGKSADQKYLILTLFPNPTSHNVVLQAQPYSGEPMSYELYDATGRRLLSGKIMQEQTEIATAHLSVATYLLQVIRHQQIIQSFNIIKYY